MEHVHRNHESCESPLQNKIQRLRAEIRLELRILRMTYRDILRVRAMPKEVETEIRTIDVDGTISCHEEYRHHKTLQTLWTMYIAHSEILRSMFHELKKAS